MKITTIVGGALQNNVYVLSNCDSCVIIDPTYDNGKTLKFIQDNGLKPLAVLLTHGHFDHCGGVKTITDVFDVPVYVSPLDKKLCTEAASNPINVQCDNCFANCDLTEGTLKIGDFCFEVVSTAGHTMGSVILLCEDVMFSGDTLFCGTVGRTDLPHSNAAQMHKSLKKICVINKDYTVLAGHGQPTTLFYEKQHNPWLKVL